MYVVEGINVEVGNIGIGKQAFHQSPSTGILLRRRETPRTTVIAIRSGVVAEHGGAGFGFVRCAIIEEGGFRSDGGFIIVAEERHVVIKECKQTPANGTMYMKFGDEIQWTGFIGWKSKLGIVSMMAASSRRSDDAVLIPRSRARAK